MKTQKQNYPQTIEEFNRLVETLKSKQNYRNPKIFALGQYVMTKNNILASVRYPVVNGPEENTGSAAIFMHVLNIEGKGVQNIEITQEQISEILQYFRPFYNDGKKHGNIEALKKASDYKLRVPSARIVMTFIFDDIAPQSVADSTLKLYALSLRHFKPNQLNLEKIFTKLPNLAWIGDTPYDSDDIDNHLLDSAFGNKEYAPHMVDKFPLYIHRINAVKMGVRITDQHKVRLGAYLGEGTTLMPGASYVNFNAGTEGPCMVEGRISSGAFVESGSDIGGGASILGTLSGGNNIPISIGRNCLLEVNCSLGISIGDAVIISAGTEIMFSNPVFVNIEKHPKHGKWVKASELSGINAVTFRRNSQNGSLEVLRTKRNEDFAHKLNDCANILNTDLHKD